MKSNSGSLGSTKWLLVLLVLGAFLSFFGFTITGALDTRAETGPQFTKDFQIKDCTFVTEGANPYFILKPGYQLVLEGLESGKKARLVITVLNKTKTINLPDVGTVKTRVIEERETAGGAPVETSRNFFAICQQTNDVYYFGEEVDIFGAGGTVTHGGAWVAGERDRDGLAQPGIVMPGTFLLGSRYYQELADGIALDRAEHMESGLKLTTSAGKFSQCIRIVETTPLESGKSEKLYCPEVGLVSDGEVKLVDYGMNIVK